MADEYYNLIMRRLGNALLNPPTRQRTTKTKPAPKKEKPPPIKEPAKITAAHPLINDDTTNSDDSDSYEEQAFHQHHTREEREAADREKLNDPKKQS